MPYFIDTGLVTKEASRTIYNAQAASIDSHNDESSASDIYST